MAFSDDDDDAKVKRAKGEDDLLSPATSDAGSDLEKAAMEKELEEQGLIRKVTPPLQKCPQRFKRADSLARGNTFEEE